MKSSKSYVKFVLYNAKTKAKMTCLDSVEEETRL